MKRILKIAALVCVALVLAILLAVYLMLNRGVKAAVEAVGPQMTKTSVRLDSVSLSPFSGSGKTQGLFVGNPEGFKGPQALSVKDASVALEISTALSDPLVIDAIRIDGAELDYETGSGGSNLERIMQNVEEFTGKSQSSRKVIIKDLLITNTKLRVSPALLMGQSMPVPVPDIHLAKIGEESHGATMGEVMKKIMEPLSKGLSGPMSQVGGSLKDMGGKTLKTGTDGIKGLFGK